MKDHKLTVTQDGYGHWTISTVHYNRVIATGTTASKLIDRYNSDDEKTRARAKKLLREIIIKDNKY